MYSPRPDRYTLFKYQQKPHHKRLFCYILGWILHNKLRWIWIKSFSYGSSSSLKFDVCRAHGIMPFLITAVVTIQKQSISYDTANRSAQTRHFKSQQELWSLQHRILSFPTVFTIETTRFLNLWSELCDFLIVRFIIIVCICQQARVSTSQSLQCAFTAFVLAWDISNVMFSVLRSRLLRAHHAIWCYCHQKATGFVNQKVIFLDANQFF